MGMFNIPACIPSRGMHQPQRPLALRRLYSVKDKKAPLGRFSATLAS